MPTMDQRYETITISNNARNDLNMTIIESATSYCQSPKVSAREFATQGAGPAFNVFDNSMGRSECSNPFFEFKISNDTKTLNATSVQPKVESDRKLPHSHGSSCDYLDKERTTFAQNHNFPQVNADNALMDLIYAWTASGISANSPCSSSDEEPSKIKKSYTWDA